VQDDNGGEGELPFDAVVARRGGGVHASLAEQARFDNFLFVRLCECGREL